MPSQAIHPREHLVEQLSSLKMTAAEFGRQLKVPGNCITAILKGKRRVTPDTAMRLGHFFNTSPRFWLSLQTMFDLRMAEAVAGSAIEKLATLKFQQSISS